MICVMLQNNVGFLEGETGSCSDTFVTCDVDGTEEVSIKVEEAIDIKDEIPEAITFKTIKTEQEVRLWGVCVCEVVAAHAFRSFISPKRKLKLHKHFLLYVMFWVPCIYKVLIAILKGRDFL